MKMINPSLVEVEYLYYIAAESVDGVFSAASAAESFFIAVPSTAMKKLFSL